MSICIRPINLCKEKHCRTNALTRPVFTSSLDWRGKHAPHGKFDDLGYQKATPVLIQTTRVQDRSLRDHANSPEFRDEFPHSREFPTLLLPLTFLNLYRQIFSREIPGCICWRSVAKDARTWEPSRRFRHRSNEIKCFEYAPGRGEQFPRVVFLFSP